MLADHCVHSAPAALHDKLGSGSAATDHFTRAGHSLSVLALTSVDPTPEP